MKNFYFVEVKIGVGWFDYDIDDRLSRPEDLAEAKREERVFIRGLREQVTQEGEKWGKEYASS